MVLGLASTNTGATRWGPSAASLLRKHAPKTPTYMRCFRGFVAPDSRGAVVVWTTQPYLPHREVRSWQVGTSAVRAPVAHGRSIACRTRFFVPW